VRLVFASAAPHKAALLRRLGLEFEMLPADLDERAVEATLGDVPPASIASALALAKASAVREAVGDPAVFVIGADQVAHVDGRRLHKPETPAAAVAQLLLLRGRSHVLVDGVALVGPDGVHTAVEERIVTMRAFGEAEARGYVERARPLECVGSYRLEDEGVRLLASIAGGDDSGVVGLPLFSVARLLRGSGLLPGP
jgi:septum formation protein